MAVYREVTENTSHNFSEQLLLKTSEPKDLYLRRVKRGQRETEQDPKLPSQNLTLLKRLFQVQDDHQKSKVGKKSRDDLSSKTSKPSAEG